MFDNLSTSIMYNLMCFSSSLVCVFCVDSEDGEGIQLPLCDGEAQSGVQRDHHQSCIVSVDFHTLYFCQNTQVVDEVFQKKAQFTV